MFSNYVKTAFRSLWRNKRYAILNITGLTLGITVCLVIYLVVRYETSFDDFHANKDRIFRLLTISKQEDGTLKRTQAIPFAVPMVLPSDISAFETVARTVHMGKRLVTVSDDKGNIIKKMKPAVFFLPPGFFGMFDYKWLAGDANSAMNDPGNVVLTRSTAEKYFGSWQQAM